MKNHTLYSILMHAKNPGQRGYTLLFAVLVSSLVLGVGVSILSIARKELLLNSSARESQYAFYAADTGYECGLYWEQQGIFASSTFMSGESLQCGTLGNGKIASSTVAMTTVVPNTSYTYDFSISIGGRMCAHVNIAKVYGPITLKNGKVISATASTLESQGYNVGWNASGNGGAGDCSGGDPSKVERALLVTY